jgi:hypothetical protein
VKIASQDGRTARDQQKRHQALHRIGNAIDDGITGIKGVGHEK